MPLLQNALVLNGRPGGQIANGGTGGSDNLDLYATSASANAVRLSTAAVANITTNTLDLGTSSLKWKDTYLNGRMTLGTQASINSAIRLNAAELFTGVSSAVLMARFLARIQENANETGTLIGCEGQSAWESAGGSVTLTKAIGVRGTISSAPSSSGGTITTAYCFGAATSHVDGTITTQVLFGVDTLGAIISGSIGTMVGLDLPTLQGTTRISLRSADSTATLRHAGKANFGANAAPTATLESAADLWAQDKAAIGNLSAMDTKVGLVIGHSPTETAATLSAGASCLLTRGGGSATAILSAGDFEVKSTDLFVAGTYRGLRAVITVSEGDGLGSYTIPSARAFVGEVSITNPLAGTLTVTTLTGLDLSTLTLTASPRVAVTTYTGIKLPTSFGVTPTTRISLDSQTDAHMRHVGGVTIGANAAPVSSILDVYGTNTTGIRLRGADSTNELGAMYIGSTGEFVIDNIGGAGEANKHVDIRPNDDNFGLIVRQGDHAATTAYANFYVVNAATDELRFSVTNTQGNADLILYENGKLFVTQELEIDGDLNHDGSNVGFFNVAPVVKQSVTALTDNSGGTGDDTIAAAGALYSQADENNMRADFARKINQLRTALVNYGLL